MRLYGKFLGIAVQTRLQYRSDFLIGIAGVVVFSSAMLGLIWVLLERFQSLKGWNYWEVVMLYSMWSISHSVYSIFFWHLIAMEDEILYGRFDRFFNRPCSILLQFIGSDVNHMGVGEAIVGITIFCVAYQNLALHWTIIQCIFFGIMLLSGVLIETAIGLIFATISFWTGRSSQFFQISLNFYRLTEQYPLDIFNKGYQVFVTFILPVAFINYYPLAGLLGKHNGLNLTILNFLSPCVAMILLTFALFFWQQGLNHYTSSGN